MECGGGITILKESEHIDQEEEIFRNIRKKVVDQLEYAGNITDDQLQGIIAELLLSQTIDTYMPLQNRMQIGKKIFNSLRKLDVLQELVDNPDITEIMINGPDSIFIEKEGHLYELEQRFESEEKLKAVIQQIVAKCNRVVNESSPIVDARLMNGSRVNIVLNPVAINGPAVTIRRFPEKPLTMENLIEKGALSYDAADFLKKLVCAGYNIIISGGTGCGKTTFLNALSGYIPKDERIITIEDSAELQIQGIRNLVRMETKNANSEGTRPIIIRDLIKTSLRMRPSRIIVGEVRGGEAFDMICSAMNCGHDGSMQSLFQERGLTGLWKSWL